MVGRALQLRKQRRLCPTAWCSFGLAALFPEQVRFDHAPGTAESMTMGLSLKGAIVSNVM
jgi:hypothetical protein